MDSTSSTQKSLSVILDEIENNSRLEDLPFTVRKLSGEKSPWIMDYKGGGCAPMQLAEMAMYVQLEKADVPALVKALRKSCERIGYFSDLYCGMNDMTGRNALEEIAAILNQDEKREKDLGKRGAAI